MKAKDIVLGMEFEQNRKKMKKDKKFFASLDNKEMDESLVEERLNYRSPAPKEVSKDDSLPSLPLGLSK